MNLNSLQSTDKIARLQADIATENPDVIIGSETKLVELFCRSEIFQIDTMAKSLEEEAVVLLLQ